MQRRSLLADETGLEQGARLRRRAGAVFQQVVGEHAQLPQGEVVGRERERGLERAQRSGRVAQRCAAQPRRLVPVAQRARLELRRELRVGARLAAPADQLVAQHLGAALARLHQLAGVTVLPREAGERSGIGLGHALRTERRRAQRDQRPIELAARLVLLRQLEQRAAAARGHRSAAPGERVLQGALAVVGRPLAPLEQQRAAPWARARAPARPRHRLRRGLARQRRARRVDWAAAISRRCARALLGVVQAGQVLVRPRPLEHGTSACSGSRERPSGCTQPGSLHGLRGLVQHDLVQVTGSSTASTWPPLRGGLPRPQCRTRARASLRSGGRGGRSDGARSVGGSVRGGLMRRGMVSAAIRSRK